MKAILLIVLMAIAVPASAHSGPDAGLHDFLPMLLLSIPFLRVLYMKWKHKEK